jgi:hypothetical protein
MRPSTYFAFDFVTNKIRNRKNPRTFIVIRQYPNFKDWFRGQQSTQNQMNFFYCLKWTVDWQSIRDNLEGLVARLHSVLKCRLWYGIVSSQLKIFLHSDRAIQNIFLYVNDALFRVIDFVSSSSICWKGFLF